MDERACATCPWWSRFPERVEYRWSSDENAQVEIRTSNDKGECRRMPPAPPRQFPVTDEGDWCGEHPERREAAGAA
ncbi:MAG: hypothetical protein GX624_02550 [Actinobacteria bacterium]|nr:hypothetical protein [Actinomycetota bacterium]